MIPVSLYNTLSRSIDPMETIEPGKIRFYACGPTVYNRVHIGNLKTFVWVDFVKRVLQACGYQVRHVLNITDVDDKIIRDAGAAGKSLEDFTAPFTEGFFQDMDTLGCLPADVYPKATELIPDMIAMVQQLVQTDHAYEAEGSVYFRVSSFSNYGDLAQLDMKGMEDGARVDHDEYDKEAAKDFVLWKAAKEGEPSWDSPWGAGRPGWHLECSVMAQKFLGYEIDLHAGGVDLIFPHHTNEIAQSESAQANTTFCRCWTHGEHLMVDGGKMSKSKGNFFTLDDLTDRDQDPVDPMDLRQFFLTTHYRKVLNFTEENLKNARNTRLRLIEFKRRLDKVGASPEAPCQVGLVDTAASYLPALAKDLDVSEAFSALFEAVRMGNTAIDGEGLCPQDHDALMTLLEQVQATLGTLAEQRDPEAERIEGLIAERKQARQDKDFVRSDAIRDQMVAEGIELMDSPEGTTWRRR